MTVKKARRRPKIPTGLTAVEAQFNRDLRKTVRRLKRAAAPIVKYQLADRFEDEFRFLAAMLQKHLIAPKGELHVADPQGPV